MTRNVSLTDDRAVSIAVTHVLTVGITTILVAGLLIGAGGLLDEEKSDAARDEMRTIGNRIAADIASVDHAAQNSGSSMSLQTSHPTRIAGGGYAVRLRQESYCAANFDVPREVPPDSACLVLEASSTNTVVVVPFDNSTAVSTSAVSGGSFYVYYDGSEITIQSDRPTLAIRASALAPPDTGARFGETEGAA
ncbi:DUF7266 family protein [Haloarchaeobius sp. DFWS5]|uniref:DUF7266 family protein n=1 Tax=Haloarchaeobius sp. DFWS5 TaxID=3446114 RepID=UPI003EB8F6AF